VPDALATVTTKATEPMQVVSLGRRLAGFTRSEVGIEEEQG